MKNSDILDSPDDGIYTGEDETIYTEGYKDGHRDASSFYFWAVLAFIAITVYYLLTNK
jgi:hypothetical protein